MITTKTTIKRSLAIPHQRELVSAEPVGFEYVVIGLAYPPF